MSIGVLWVVAGAVLFGVGTLMQAHAVAGPGSPGALLRAVRHPLFLVGGLAELAGALAHVAALQAVPMAVAQAAVSGSLAVTALGARLVLGVRVGTRGVAAIATLSAAPVALAAVSGEAGTPADDGTATVALVAATVVLGLVATLLPALTPARRAMVAAVVSGLAFAACSVATRLLDTSSVLACLTDPALLALVVAGGVGALAWTVALRHGTATSVTAVVVVSEVVPPSLLGPWLGDEVGTAFAAVAPVALLVASAAAVVLARTPHEPPARRRDGAHEAPAAATLEPEVV